MYFEGGVWDWIEHNNPKLYAEALALTRPDAWRILRRSPTRWLSW
jgi:hypothetical protein